MAPAAPAGVSWRLLLNWNDGSPACVSFISIHYIAGRTDCRRDLNRSSRCSHLDPRTISQGCCSFLRCIYHRADLERRQEYETRCVSSARVLVQPRTAEWRRILEQAVSTWYRHQAKEGSSPTQEACWQQHRTPTWYVDWLRSWIHRMATALSWSR